MTRICLPASPSAARQTMMTFRQIEFGSDDFRKECGLRQRVLRAPLGLCLYDEDLGGEKAQLHFGLFDGEGALVGCVIAVALSRSQAKIRQMAVAQEQQGRGYGRQLIEGLEAALAQRGLTDLCLHARKTAVGFYERLGYVAVGPDFIEVGLPHVEMEKRLKG